MLIWIVSDEKLVGLECIVEFEGVVDELDDEIDESNSVDVVE